VLNRNYIQTRLPSNLRPTTREVTSYARSLLVTWQRWRSHHSIPRIQKPHVTRRLHGSMFYRTGVIADRSFKYIAWIGIFDLLLLLPWPWLDDLHIPAWPVFPQDMLDVRKWTFYVKAFESCRLTDMRYIGLYWHACAIVHRPYRHTDSWQTIAYRNYRLYATPLRRWSKSQGGSVGGSAFRIWRWVGPSNYKFCVHPW